MQSQEHVTLYDRLGGIYKGLSKTKSSHYGILLEEKRMRRDEYGTD